MQGLPKKSVNSEIGITFEQMATHRCVRIQIGGIFGFWTPLNYGLKFESFMCLHVSKHM